MGIKDEIARFYGISKDVLNNFSVIEGKKKSYICTKPAYNIYKKLNAECAGISFSKRGAEIKLSTFFITMFGKYIKKRIINVDKKYIAKILKNEIIDIESNKHGIVVIKCGDDYICAGIIKNKKLQPLIPKTKVIVGDIV